LEAGPVTGEGSQDTRDPGSFGGPQNERLKNDTTRIVVSPRKGDTIESIRIF